MERIELQPGYTISRVIKGGWHLAGGHGVISEEQALEDMYAFVKDGEIKPDMSRFEGSHFETENEYSILVYHRPLGLDYDRLLSIKTMPFPPQD